MSFGGRAGVGYKGGMGKMFESIGEEHRRFIERQKMFFVATAPLDEKGRVNLSPKGLDCLRVLSPNRVAYMDLTGSGNETGAHVGENGRITLMFCAFEDPALIMRLYGRGRVVLRGTKRWDEMVGLFPKYPGMRQIIEVEVTGVGTSCGSGVPRYEFAGQREKMADWASRRGEEAMAEYRRKNNRRSIDGLAAPMAAGEGEGENPKPEARNPNQ